MFRWRSVDEFVEEARGLPWAFSVLRPFPVAGVSLNFFVQERKWVGHSGVDLERVAGTVHPDYVGLSWHQFLLKGKRMAHNLGMLQANPGYYLQSGMKLPTMSYLVHQDEYWVYADGNHRTCIGRFFLALSGMECVLDGVETWDVVLDLEAFEKWWEFGAFKGPLRVESVLENRDDGPGWMRERYRLRYFIGEREVSRNEFLAYNEAPGFWKFFRQVLRWA